MRVKGANRKDNNLLTNQRHYLSKCRIDWRKVKKRLQILIRVV